VLKKWVYPVFIKAIDDRQKALEAGLNASKAAQEQAKQSGGQTNPEQGGENKGDDGKVRDAEFKEGDKK
jgi:hypothetical protein